MMTNHYSKNHRWTIRLLFVGLCCLLCLPSLAAPISLETLQFNTQLKLPLPSSFSGGLSTRFRLSRIETLIQNKQLDSAQQQLTAQRSLPFNDTTWIDEQLMQAQVDIANNQFSQAETITRQLTRKPLNQPQWVSLQLLTATILQQQKQYIRAINTRLALASRLDNTHVQQQNWAAIWRTFLHLNHNALTALNKEKAAPEASAWLQLALMATPPILSASFTHTFQQWLHQHPQHPAQSFLNVNAFQKNSAHLTQTHHLALLLPLTGPRQQQGRSIRDGFLASYYQQQTPFKPIITLYDTNTTTPSALYQKAVRQGADLIVGPLQKTAIDQLLASTTLSVPTLLLNQTATPLRATSPTFQFALSPKDEAKQIAANAWQAGHKQALIIAPHTAWGEHVAHVFTDQWQQLGRPVASTFLFPSNPKSWPNHIQNVLGVSLSNSRQQALKAILRTPIRFVPRKRQDIDMVFLVADARQAQQIIPLLKFYFLGNTPIYTTSYIYQKNWSPAEQKDIQAVTLCDIPWIVGQNEPSSLSTLKPQNRDHSPEYTRLFAFGIDAYRLTRHLLTLTTLPYTSLAGATGSLSITPQGQITRTLSCRSLTRIWQSQRRAHDSSRQTASS